MSTGFTTLELIVAAILVLASAGLSLVLKLGIHRSLLIAAARMVVQLLLVGLLLRSIFDMTNPWLTAGLVVFMVLAASYEVAARQERKLAGGWTFLVSGAAVSASTMFVSLFALASVSLTQDWTAPQVVIPIAGIVLGTAMNAASVSPPSYRSGRRRPRVRTTCHWSTMYPAAWNWARLCPSTMCRIFGMQSGKRPAEYANAARSGSMPSAPRCRLDREYRWASSNARTRTSPLDRSSE